MKNPAQASSVIVGASLRRAAFIGTIVCSLVMLQTQFVHAQTFTVIHTFNVVDGLFPYAGPTLDAQGKLYGVTSNGGNLNCDGGGPAGCGVVFQLKEVHSNWIFSLLHEFGNSFLPTYPSQITIGPNGIPYGAELEGGSFSQGTLYSLLPPLNATIAVNSPWTYNLIYTFGNGNDGTYPHKIIFDTAGNIFGVTGRGGTSNDGTVYELSRSGQSWTENILYNFAGGADGYLPKEVVFDDSGDLYGVTEQGGNPGCSPFQGCGTIFKMTRSESGWTKTILHAFDQNTEGGYPSPLLRDSSGNLFGVTSQNGPNNFGVIWELSPSNGSWVFNVLYSFTQQSVALQGPFAPIMDAGGALYGVNNTGGVNNCGGNFLEPCGDIYKLTPSQGSWTYTDVHDFDLGDGGCLPVGPLALDDAGHFYGVTRTCGGGGAGVVYEFTP